MARPGEQRRGKARLGRERHGEASQGEGPPFRKTKGGHFPGEQHAHARVAAYKSRGFDVRVIGEADIPNVARRVA